MPKGKKFTAAEKHFSKKIEERDKTIKYLRTRNEELFTDKCKLEVENENLKQSLANAQKIIKELQAMKNLSDEEVKSILKGSMAVSDFVNLMTTGKLKMGGLY